MMNKEIRSFDDFCKVLLDAGFSMGGGNDEGIFAVVPFGWDTEPPYETSVRWHTKDMETDPWEWRMRVLDERNDIAYGKLFFNKSGYITREWYSCFLAVRRNKMIFDEAYQNGTISLYAKKIYDLFSEHKTLALHEIKQLGNFKKEDKSKFDRALTELQMKMYITMCGRQGKRSKSGEEYGWSSTVFCTVENFFDISVFDEADSLTRDDAIQKITTQIYGLNPDADAKKIKKFIGA